MDITNKRKYIIVYTICCGIMLFGASLPWIMKGTSFVWKIDGIAQHYPALVYFGETIREFISGVIKGQIQWKMWDLNIGFGSDVVGTLNYYCIGDPLDLLSGLVPKTYMEYVYTFFILLRIYLAGLAFSAFAFYKNVGYKETLIGAFTYSFSGYVLIYGIKHPLFVNAMIYLPMLLIGLDKILKKEKSIMFTIMITISLISNFYFFYILTIAMVLYAMYRVCDLHKTKLVKKYVTAFFRCTGYYLIGILNAMILFLPVLYAFSNTKRSGVSAFPAILYNKDYYISIFTHIVSYGTIGAQTNLGYCSISVILFAILLCKKGEKYNIYRIFSIISCLGLILPIVGFGMTGFSYVANRWIFLFTFVFSMGVARILEDRNAIKMKELWLAVILVILSMIVIVCCTELKGNDVLGIVFLTLALVMLIGSVKTKFLKKSGAYCVIMLFLIIECTIKMVWIGALSEDAMSSQFVPRGKVNSIMINKAIKKIKKNDPTLYRIESMDEASSNYGLTNDAATVSSYYSITPSVVSEAMEDLENADLFTSVWTKHLSRRTKMLQLANVKYYLKRQPSSDQNAEPYNYKLVDEICDTTENGSNVNIMVYKNKSPLGFIYGYDNYMEKEDWDKLNSYDKENAMMQLAVMNQTVRSKNIKKKTPVTDSKVMLTKKQIFAQIKQLNDKNIEIKGDKIYVKKAMINVPLTFKQKMIVNYI